MMGQLGVEELLAFEESVASAFNRGEILAPVHLYHGNEAQMIEVFQNIENEDWVFCSWRSHYQCLLKGVPEELVLSEILEGRSISLCFPEYRIFSSAIVGGVLPIATGVAWSIKRSAQSSMVYCFLGDMTAETGIAHECIKYSSYNKLPIVFVVEDNGKSVCTDTRKAWGMDSASYLKTMFSDNVRYYSYDTKFPHAGAGVRVEF